MAHYNSMAEWIPQRLKQFKMPSQRNTHRNSPQSHLPLSYLKHHQMSLTLYILKKIDGQLIQKIALKIDGAAGPSSLDATSWKRLCSCYNSSSGDLCSAIASIASNLCSQYVNPKGISAFVACRLIAFDKQPGPSALGRPSVASSAKPSLKYFVTTSKMQLVHFKYVLDSYLGAKQPYTHFNHMKLRLRF